jgi:hypothetical protein
MQFPSGMDSAAPNVWLEKQKARFKSGGRRVPIGSGEVESAHRDLIQKRLKLPGAWWLADNAQAMRNLRSMRANRRWDCYWKSSQA